MSSLHSNSDTEAGAVAETANPPPGPELVDDDAGPAPPVSMTDVSYDEAEKGSAGSKKAGKNVELVGDDDEGPAPTVVDDGSNSKMAAKKTKAERAIVDPVFEEDAAAQNRGGDVSSGNAGGPNARHGRRDVPRPPAESSIPAPQDRSTIRIPEAWAVTTDHEEEGDEEEVFIATRVEPPPPWWKQEQNKLYTWALLCLFSIIALTAHETDDQNMKRSENLWITACSATSLSLSALASLAYVGGNTSIGRYFVGRTLESVLSVIMFGMWCGALPVIMDPANGLALMYVGTSGSSVADYQATLSNFNLYFSSWGSLICALTAVAMYIGERRGTAGGTGMGYIARWCLLMLASIIVIVESSRFKNQVCSIEGGTEDSTCVKNMWGLVTACVGLVLSFSMSILSYRRRDSAVLTSIAGFVIVCNYTICVGVTCFGDGPATYIGNHDLAAWAGFFMALAVFGGALKEYLKERSSAVAEAETNVSEWKKYVIGGIALLAVILAVVLGVTLSSKNNSGKDVDVDLSVPATKPALSSEALVDQSIELIADEQMTDPVVAIYGDTAIVGSPNYDETRGIVIVFMRGEDGEWTRQATLTPPNEEDYVVGTKFGWSVDIYDDTLVVGAPRSYDENFEYNKGSAHVFVREDGAWKHQTKLFADNAVNHDLFGHDAAVHGNTAIISAPWDDESGAVYVFVRNGGTGEWTQQSKLLAPDRESYDERYLSFGNSIDIYEDTVVIGASYDNYDVWMWSSQGSVHVFEQDGGGWAYKEKLTDESGRRGDGFGDLVAIDGDTMVIGAREVDDDEGRIDIGAAHVFVRDDSGWTQQSELVAPDGDSWDEFGNNVDIYGDTVIVAAMFDDDRGYESGSVHVYVSDGNGGWEHQAKLLAPEGEHGDFFGSSTGIFNGTIIVGSKRGEMHVFEY